MRPRETREWDRHVAPRLVDALPAGWMAPGGRGTWVTEAWSAGAHSLLGEWADAQRAWAGCLAEMAYFDEDLDPWTRRLAAHGVDAEDDRRREALVSLLVENEHEMRPRWHVR